MARIFEDEDFLAYRNELHKFPYFTFPSDDEKNQWEEVMMPPKVFSLKIARAHPAKWIHQVCGVKPRDYQFKMLDAMYNYTRVAGVTSRQVGKSFCIAGFTFWAAYNNVKPSGTPKKTRIGIVSRTEPQAKKLLKDIYAMVKMADERMARATKDTPYYDKAYFSNRMTEKPTQFKLEWPGGSIEIFPPTGSVRGNSFSYLIVDEADFLRCEDPDYFFNSEAVPTVKATQGNIILFSTPKGTPSFFYNIIRPNNESAASGWIRIWLPWTCNEEEMDMKIGWQERQRYIEKGDEMDFKIEYEASFLSGKHSYFNPEKVDEAVDESLQEEFAWHRPVTLGLDFGDTHSRTVLTVVDHDKERNETRLLWYKEFPSGYNNADLPNFIDNLRLKGRYAIKEIVVDDCLEENTEVVMSDFQRKKIKDVKVGDYVRSYDFNNNQYVNKKVKNKWDKGFKQTYSVNFRNGTSVEATADHKWFVRDKRYNKLSVMKTKDIDPKKYYIPFSIQQHEDYTDLNQLNEIDAYLIGMYIAEGHKRPTKHAFFISQLKQDHRDKIQEKLKQTNYIWQTNQKGFYLSRVDKIERILNDCGISSYTKKIPEYLFQQPRRILESLWEGLIDGDGSRQSKIIDNRGLNKGAEEVYCTVSPQLDSDVRYLGMLIDKPMHHYFGIRSGFGSTKVQYKPEFRENSHLGKGKLFINSIEKSEYRQVYDIEVEDTHSFILADSGAITHNCVGGKTAIELLRRKGFNLKMFVFKRDKHEYYEYMKAAFANNRIKLYRDPAVIAQFKSLESVETASGNIQIRKPSGGKDDICDSLVMACSPYIQIKKHNGWRFSNFGEQRRGPPMK